MKHNIFHQDQRMLILYALSESNHAANAEVLQDCLQMYGHRVSLDLVKNQLGWLEEQGLITINKVRHLWVAKLTPRGFDVSQNNTKVEGVKQNPFIDGFC